MKATLSRFIKFRINSLRRSALQRACYLATTGLLLGTLVAVASNTIDLIHAQGVGPTVLDPNLAVRAIVTGLALPTSMVFLPTPNPANFDILVLEKNTGNVKRVQRVGEQVTISIVLQLGVNNFSERGTLGIALHPNFPTNPGVYIFWTESESGNVTSVPSDTPLIGNRVDRFVWDGKSLMMDRNIIRLRSRQADAGQPERGNHDGGVIRFGPDNKLYIQMGDNGRRGWMQNLTEGFGPDGMDDQFGGPEPDNAHFTGVMIRLNDDGSAPQDNPFFDVGAQMGGEVGANIQKIFSYGLRNGFGFAFDPFTGELWESENGDDAYDEINRIEAGMNGGWIQIMGPVERITEFKGIETTPRFFGLQQIRWDPTLIANNPQQARQRLFVLPGSHYRDPEFSWRYAVPPAGLGFLSTRALGPEYEGNMFVGAATAGTNPIGSLANGFLVRFKLTNDRRSILFDDPRLNDTVADNFDKHAITESESLMFGTDFGVGTDIQTGPNGNLFVVSLTNGAIYEIRRR